MSAPATACANPLCSCDPCGCGDDCRCGASKLSKLERRAMEFVWSAGGEVTVRDVAAGFPEYAYTTVATVLDRLASKGVLRTRTVDRTKRYAAVGSAGTHAAVLMYDALSTAGDAEATLRRFARSLDGAEAAVLRDALRARQERPDPRR
jgi:predicted transcriptional regulator